MDCDSCEAAPVVFKRATQKKPRLCAPNEAVKYTESTDKAVFKSSKLVMPEYVVGREKKKEKKVRSTSPGSKYDKSKEIKLHHLQFQEDPE
ncbi:hypothetical protein PR048_022746 [Dryococelus australis]|nr:hypothetical protein PR048_022746 [Dryococelus australis]